MNMWMTPSIGLPLERWNWHGAENLIPPQAERRGFFRGLTILARPKPPLAQL